MTEREHKREMYETLSYTDEDRAQDEIKKKPKEKREKPKQTFSMTKKQKLRVFGSIGLLLLLYILFAFVPWDWNVSKWGNEYRALFVFIASGSILILNVLIDNEIN